MFKNLFEYKRISDKDELFLIKANQFLIENCKAVYGTEYLPRLIQRICRTIDINIECHKGILTITKDNKRYTIEHAFNVLNGQIVDLGLFMIKQCYTRRDPDSESINQFKEVPVFPELPNYIISGFKNSNLPSYVSYESKKLILNGDFQTNIVIDNDKLILGIYNNCIASNIAKLIIDSELDRSEHIKPDILFNQLEELKVECL